MNKVIMRLKRINRWFRSKKKRRKRKIRKNILDVIIQIINHKLLTNHKIYNNNNLKIL